VSIDEGKLAVEAESASGSVPGARRHASAATSRSASVVPEADAIPADR